MQSPWKAWWPSERTEDLQQANEEITRLNDQLKDENLRLSAELDIARQLQMMVLPPESEISLIPDLDIACFMEPADEVGGDYYDVLQVGDSVYLSIGDVTGHGLSSGVVMMMAQTAYAALHVPEIVPAGWLRREDIAYVLSYLLNELFENCAKFSAGPELLIHYQTWLEDERMIFQLTNHITPEGERPFIQLIQELLTGDPDELYFQKLEENAAQDLGGSGLGYLTLIKDHGIQFGFRFRPISPESTAVDVRTRVSLKEPK